MRLPRQKSVALNFFRHLCMLNPSDIAHAQWFALLVVKKSAIPTKKDPENSKASEDM